MALEYLKNLGRTKEALKMGPLSPIQKAVKDWAEGRIDDAKDNLMNGFPPHDATGSLAQSIAFTISNAENVTIDFLMNDYWDFVNQGVNGVERPHGSVYSFKTLNPSPAMIDSLVGLGSLDGWMRSKGITQLVWTNEFGERIENDLVTEDDFRAAGYVFARAIKRKGIEGNHFVDEAFSEEQIGELEDKILDEIMNLL